METLQNFRYLSFSTQLALCSFGLGSLIFGSYFVLPENEGIIIIGLFFVIFAGFFNSIMFLRLLFLLLVAEAEERESIVIRMLLLLANIPIAILYGYLVIHSFQSSQQF